jgi:UTP--glucose-1-phosphate uridylyltransferase
MNITKAIIPAAGMGTRFLPATKTMPKEMLPIVDTPVLQFVVEEAVASGIEDILIVTGRAKRSIENHLDYHPELESFLKANGKEDLVDQVRDIADRCRVFYIRQKVQAGLGDAIRLGRRHIGDEPFAVLLGDTIIDVPEGEDPGLKQLCDAYQHTAHSVVAVRKVPPKWVSRYGIVDGEADPEVDGLYRLNQLVEKPAVEDAPSDMAIAGRYIFTPEIFEHLDRTRAGVGGEIQLTDAMNTLAAEQPMHALLWNAHRYDIGNKADYARCFIDYALRNPDTADAVRAHLRDHR